MKKRDNPKELRCRGDKRGRNCNQLLYKYSIEGDEVIIICKCPNCNGFNTLSIKLISENKGENL